MPVVLCYGDSNTHGTTPLTVLGEMGRYDRGKRWPDVMARILGPDFEVISEGLPGRTTVHDDVVEGGGRNGLAVMPAILHSHKPIDLMILMLGTNDLKPAFGVGAFEISRSVERLIRVARAEAVVNHFLIVAPAPVREAGVLADVFRGAEDRQKGMAEYYQSVAGRMGCHFVDAGAHIEVSAIDGVHWEQEAHLSFGEAMAQEVRACLEN